MAQYKTGWSAAREHEHRIPCSVWRSTSSSNVFEDIYQRKQTSTDGCVNTICTHTNQTLPLRKRLGQLLHPQHTPTTSSLIHTGQESSTTGTITTLQNSATNPRGRHDILPVTTESSRSTTPVYNCSPWKPCASPTSFRSRPWDIIPPEHFVTASSWKPFLFTT